ncbi:MAG TPA: hypothetical protein VNU95_01505 [Candidatus Acidoferrales bacterium]|nr:hypothetical protein [Candidatus Acidoferrales bacterium]
MKANLVRVFFALTGILLFCGQALAGPLDNWTWRNPLPNGNPVVGTNVLDSVVFTNGNFYAVGFLGTVASSSDGRFWTEYPSATTNQLTQIIYAGGQFVAVGNNGTIETSTDAVNWVLQTSGVPNNLVSLAYANGIYLTCGGGQVLTSPDAVNWTFTPITKFRNLGAVAGSSFGFVGINGSTNVYFSTDGMNWTTNGLTASGSVFNNESLVPQIVTYADGLFLVGAYRHATSESANAYIFSSPDGTHWTANLVGNFFTGFSEFFYNFFMTGSNDVIAAGEIGPSGPATSFLQFSTNGLNWTQVNGLPGTFPQGYGGAYGNGTYVILGYSSLYVSPDSLNWTNYPYVSSLSAGPDKHIR